jgi:hypothetical protein
VKTLDLKEYIKLAHNSFMQRGAAILSGRISAADPRDDLTVPLTAQPQVTQPAQTLAARAPATPVKKAVRAEVPVANLPMTAAQVTQRVKAMQAAYQPSLLSPRDQESLLPARSIEMARSYENFSGNRVLPTTRAMTIQQRRQALCDSASPIVRRILVNSGHIAAPMAEGVKRIVANTRPSTLSAEDQRALMVPAVVRILSNYAAASGINRLPSERLDD